SVIVGPIGPGCEFVSLGVVPGRRRSNPPGPAGEDLAGGLAGGRVVSGLAAADSWPSELALRPHPVRTRATRAPARVRATVDERRMAVPRKLFPDLLQRPAYQPRWQPRNRTHGSGQRSEDRRQRSEQMNGLVLL